MQDEPRGALRLEDEVALAEVDDALQLDRHVGLVVAVDVGVDHRLVLRRALLVDLVVDEVAGLLQRGAFLLL